MTATARLSIDTDLTIYHASLLKGQLLDAVRGNERLELDLSQVGEMDTAGFQLLVMAKHEAQRLGRELALVAHSPAVLDVIGFYNMSAFFGDQMVIPAQH